MIRMPLVGLALLAFASASNAADITIDVPQSGDPVIHVNGPIVEGDDGKLAGLIPQGRRRATVSLSSPGGLAFTGIAMGRIIREQSWSTAVPPRSMCASACGLVWIAGVSRTISSDGRVGFHAAFRGDDPSRPEDGAANAVIGAYLSRLGYDDSTIMSLTSAAPSAMLWLNAKGVENPGVSYEIASAVQIAVAPSRPVQSAATLQTDGSFSWLFDAPVAIQDQSFARMSPANVPLGFSSKESGARTFTLSDASRAPHPDQQLVH